MARVVAVHGIGQQYEGPDSLRSRWLPALRDGMALAGGSRLGEEALRVAFYGDLFRPKGKSVGTHYDARDLGSEWEQAMLRAWWEEAARLDSAVPDPSVADKGRTPMLVQRALSALTRSRHFVALSERALIGDLKQVHAYLHDAEVRAEARRRVRAAIEDDTQVLLGHSLGSIVAYEVLCEHPELPVRSLVTLGSPLGIRNLIFERLQPAPSQGVGHWPGKVKHWINVADRADVVALEKALSTLFGARVQDVRVDNGATAHDARPYLTARETGMAVVTGLAAR